MHYKSILDIIQNGERVAYSREFLRSIGEYTGEMPQARGTVLELITIGETTLARLDWHGAELPERVNVKNLVLVNAMQWEER